MKTFFIVVSVIIFTATSWTPEPCSVPQIFTYQEKIDTAFSDTCRKCAIQVKLAAEQQINVLQIDHSGVRFVTDVKIDSTTTE